MARKVSLHILWLMPVFALSAPLNAMERNSVTSSSVVPSGMSVYMMGISLLMTGVVCRGPPPLLPRPTPPQAIASTHICTMVTCQERIVFAPGAGLEVTEAIPATDGTIQKRTFMHKVFLLSISADSPARQKMAMWPAVAAYIACGWCLFEGCKIDGEAAATRFKGYAEPAEQVLLGGSPCKVGAARLQVSDFLHHQRARSVEDGSSAAQKSGCNGYSVFPEMLSYAATLMYGSCPSTMQVRFT